MNFNYNTYIQLSPLFLRAAHTISRAVSGRYYLNKTDEKKDYFFILKESGMTLKVPFKALFSTNKKLDGIPGFNFSPALLCPSRAAGLCQLKNDNICYAVRGQLQSGGINNGLRGKNGFIKMNSYWSDILTMTFIEAVKKDIFLFYKFFEYINDNIDLIRFNKGGDFKNKSDALFLEHLAMYCPDTIFYGYTARDDLNINFKSKNIYLNGSNKKYTNRFKATNDIKEYINHRWTCNGYCNGCCKCWTLKGKNILCFIHGKKEDIKLLTRTRTNINYLNSILKSLNIQYDLNQSTDIIKDFYNKLVEVGAPAAVKNNPTIKDIVFILHNINLLNVEPAAIEATNNIIFEGAKNE